MTILLVFILFFHLCAAAFGQSSGRTESFPRIEPDVKALEFFQRGAANSGYSWTDLAEISVWASGGNAASLELIHSLAAAIRTAPGFPAADRERAAFIAKTLSDFGDIQLLF